MSEGTDIRGVAGSIAAMLRRQQELGTPGLDASLIGRLERSVSTLLSDAPPAPEPDTSTGGVASDPRAGAAGMAGRRTDGHPSVPAASAATPDDTRPREAHSGEAHSGETHSGEAHSGETQSSGSPRPPSAKPSGGDEQRRKEPSRRPARPRQREGERPIWATPSQVTPPKGVGSPELEAIRADLGDCERCGLSARRKTIVFGVGNPNARLMFIGEAPGADEDRQGEPFVGKAGQLLTRMIGAMGLRREDVYIANILKCRPPGNRDPQPDEVAMCRPFLDRQIAAVKPEVIVTLGRIAPTALFGRDVRVTKERGTWTEYRGVPVMLTLHPAYLLRQAAAKRDAWSDLQQVMARLGLEPPSKR